MAGNTLRINAADELRINATDTLTLDGASLAGEIDPDDVVLGVTQTVVLTAAGRKTPVIFVFS